jgi:hypothetical protein
VAAAGRYSIASVFGFINLILRRCLGSNRAMDDQLYPIPSDSARRRPPYHASNSRGARVAKTATPQNTGTRSGRGDRTGGTFKAGDYFERTEGGRSSWSHELDRTRSVDRRCLEVSLTYPRACNRLTYTHSYRYLRVKFGVRWTDLKDLQEPLRIGEVLILPVTGFSPGVGLFGAKSPFGGFILARTWSVSPRI